MEPRSHIHHIRGSVTMGTMEINLEVTVSGKVGRYVIIGLEDTRKNKLILDFDNNVVCYEDLEQTKKVSFVHQPETQGETSLSAQQQQPPKKCKWCDAGKDRKSATNVTRSYENNSVIVTTKEGEFTASGCTSRINEPKLKLNTEPLVQEENKQPTIETIRNC
jgi:hypothetical protein